MNSTADPISSTWEVPNSLEDRLRFLNTCDTRLTQVYREYAQEHGLSDTALWVFLELTEASVPVTQVGLAKNWGLPLQTINSSIKKLEKEGYVELLPLPGKGREKQICLTEAGKAKCEKLIKPLHDAECSSFSQFSDSQQAFLIEMFDRFLQSFTYAIQKDSNDRADHC